MGVASLLDVAELCCRFGTENSQGLMLAWEEYRSGRTMSTMLYRHDLDISLPDEVNVVLLAG
jgi:hypothetical protein